MIANTKNKMDKKTQIELAKYIVDVLYVNDFPHDAEHIYNAIECFYDETFKAKLLRKPLYNTNL